MFVPLPVNMSLGAAAPSMAFGGLEIAEMASSQGYSFELEWGPRSPFSGHSRLPQARFYKKSLGSPSVELILTCYFRSGCPSTRFAWRRVFAFSRPRHFLCHNFSQITGKVRAGVLPSHAMVESQDLMGVWNRLWAAFWRRNRGASAAEVLGLVLPESSPVQRSVVLPTPVPSVVVPDVGTFMDQFHSHSPLDPRLSCCRRVTPLPRSYTYHSMPAPRWDNSESPNSITDILSSFF